MKRTLSHARQMANTFLQLPHHEKVRITRAIGVDDAPRSEQETWVELFKQARDQNKVGELDRLIEAAFRQHAVQVHLYEFDNLLRPRGILKKESLSADVLERARSIFDNWVDPKYGDSRPRQEVAQKIMDNARQEIEAALAVFAAEVGASYQRPDRR